jgi:rhodanese-related sulfurtransferase
VTDAKPQSFKSVTIDEARAKSAEGLTQIVDIRAPFDFAGGHIPGAINFPGQSLRTRAPQLKRDREVLLISAEGQQSRDICALALSMGFTDVGNIEGGFETWLEAGYPVHTISDSM